jgi:NTP pyrophosphatase (non-canonical NTP hydrolase)
VTGDSGLTFRQAQAAVWDNKVRQGFNTTDLGEEFCLLAAELGEAVDAWRKHRAPRPGCWRRLAARLRLRPLPPPVTDVQPVRLEVADVILFALSIAQMARFDAGDAVADKLRINQERGYRRLPGGAHVKAGSGSADV